MWNHIHALPADAAAWQAQQEAGERVERDPGRIASFFSKFGM